tara:strand:- start:216 stop:455 length:240 start_codon:yes stop_codon:yes gene_type:complete
VVEVALYIIFLELTVVLVEVLELNKLAVVEIPLAQRHLKVTREVVAVERIIFLTLEEEEEVMYQLGQLAEMFLVMVVLV